MPRHLFFFLLFFVPLMGCEKNDDNPLASIQLSELIINDDDVELNWTVSHNSFSSFHIVRKVGVNDPNDESYNPSSQIIARLDKKNLSFIDENVPYSPLVSYWVLGNLSTSSDNSNSSKTILSNLVEYSRDIPLVSFRTNDIVYYEKKDVLFLIDKAFGLIKAYNYMTKTETDFDCRSQLGFCTLHTNNQTDELLVPRADGWLFIYNAQNFELIEQIKISPHSLISSVIKDNLIFTSTSGYNQSIIVTNRTTGENIPSSNSSLYDNIYERLEFIPNTNSEFFGVNSKKITYYSYNSNGQYISSNIYEPGSSVYTMSAHYKVIPNSKKIISTPFGNVFDHSIAYINGLPRGSLNFSDFVLSSDGTIVLAACSNSKSIEVYSLNDYSHIETIETKGYPTKIFYNNGKVIAVSKHNSSNYDSYNSNYGYYGYYGYDFPYNLILPTNELFVEEIEYVLN